MAFLRNIASGLRSLFRKERVEGELDPVSRRRCGLDPFGRCNNACHSATCGLSAGTPSIARGAHCGLASRIVSPPRALELTFWVSQVVSIQSI
jgi:hypothetical protein